MQLQFRLPDLGEGLTESEIVSWHVSVGDSVTLNQVIAEVETAKAVVELPSPYAGTVSAIKHEPGTVVAVGEVIIEFDVAADSTTDPTSDAGAAAVKRVPTLVGYGADPESSAAPVRRARVPRSAAPTPQAAEPVSAEKSAGAAQPAEAPPAGAPPAEAAQPPAARPEVSEASAAPVLPDRADRPRSTPPVRKLARDMGIELEQLAGTGARGLITRADVLGSVQDSSADAPDHAVGDVNAMAATASDIDSGREQAREVRTPIKGVRKFMAQAMVESAFTAPQVSEFLTIDVTAGMDFLAKLRSRPEFSGLKLTPLTLAAKAVTLAIARHPALNSHWDDKAQEVVSFNYLNLGIAAATPRGLVVPNIKDVQTLGLRGLAEALGLLAETARAGKTPPADLKKGTFTITNIGVFGIDAGTPMLNPGEAGILAMGAVRRIPWEHQGEVALRHVMTLSLTFDHRLVDGAQGSRFLAEVGAIMADPAMALVLA